MVCPKHHIRGLEEGRLFVMGSWKSYVYPNIPFSFLFIYLFFLISQPVREKAFYGALFFLPSSVTENSYFVSAPPLLKISRICETPGRH
jgi:hypothetical protein